MKVTEKKAHPWTGEAGFVARLVECETRAEAEGRLREYESEGWQRWLGLSDDGLAFVVFKRVAR